MTEQNSKEWNKFINKFIILFKRSNNILKKYKSKEQLEQVKKIHQKISNLTPPEPPILENKNLIKKMIEEVNRSREGLFQIEAEQLGFHLLNCLMYLHGVAQTYYATQWYHMFIYYYRSNNEIDNELKGIIFRKYSKLILFFDFILLSAMEYLVKNFPDEIFENMKIEFEQEDFTQRVILFIEEYLSYFNEMRIFLYFNLPGHKKTDLFFAPGLYYFRTEINQIELFNYSKDIFELKATLDSNYIEKSKNSFKVIYNDFKHLNDIWYNKFGYNIKNLISVAIILLNKLLDKISPFFEEYEGDIPVFEFHNINGRKPEYLKNIFFNYIKKLIQNYFKNHKRLNPIINTRDLKKSIRKRDPTIKNQEIIKIILELTADPEKPFILGVNKLANKLLYYLGNGHLYPYLIGYPGAIRERFYNRLLEISQFKKEYVLTNQIKRILINHGFRIHPLSSHQIINDQRITLGEIDIIATRKSKLLLFIESKIIPHKKINLYEIRDFEQHIKAMDKRVKKFDNNITIFEKYCRNESDLKHFLNYHKKETLNIDKFEIRKNYFITPYMLFYPQDSDLVHKIEKLSVSLFEHRIENI